MSYLIRTNSETGFRRAVQEASSRWGGFSEPIVPVRANGRVDAFWSQVVELANVDEAVNVDVDPEVAKTVALRLGLPLQPISLIDRNGRGRFTCYPGVTSSEMTTPNLAMNVTSSAIPQFAWTYAENSLDLWAITAAGALTPEALKAARDLHDPIGVLSFPIEIALAQLRATTGMDRTAVQFRERWASPPPFPSSAIIWFCNKRSLQDCLMYWNLRSLRPLAMQHLPMILLPAYEVDHWLNFASGVHAMLSGRADQYSPDVFLCSLGVAHDRLRSIGDSWGLIASSKPPSTQMGFGAALSLRSAPFTYLVDIDPRLAFLWHRRYGTIVSAPTQVFRDKTSVTFESPVHFFGSGGFKLNMSSEILRRLPRRESVARLVVPNGHWHDDGIELFSSVTTRYRLDIRIPPFLEIVSTLLAEAGTSWSLSDKGRMGEGISSSSDVATLLHPGVLEAVQDMTTPRSTHLVKEIERREHTDEELDRAKFVAEYGGRLERRSLAAGDLRSLKKSLRVDVLELLVDVHWAERGFRIACSRCGLTSFVELERISSAATCLGCRSNQSYQRSAEGPVVYYRLNSLIDRASDQGVLPHLLVAAVLNEQSSDTYVLPGIDVTFADAGPSEVDLFGVHDGLVVAGEVKTSAAEFTDAQVRRDVELSKRLNADRHLMACVETLPEAIVTYAEQAAARSGLGLIMLDRKKMRPS